MAYRVLEARATVVTTGILVTLAALAWWSSVERARGMTAMADMGMQQELTAAVFMAMWLTMMIAMMFPTIAPIVLLHRMVMRRAAAGPWTTVAFVAGYLLAWAAAGLVPLAGLLAFRSVAPGASWVAPAGGLTLIVAGLYQFTGWKKACQKACRSPLTFLSTHNFGSGLVGAARVGVIHGLYCLGCCWALMAVLFVVGLMNLVWMAAIAVVFLVEKHWRHGLGFARVVGTGISAVGVAILMNPSLLTTVAGP
jgi:predicted metal-binding membrane protein